MPIAVAAPNDLAARAGRDVAEAGGNAVDAAIAAALVAMTTEPGICSIPGGAYLTIEPVDGPAETIDANVSMPGHGLPRDRFGRGVFDITTEYGGGVDITIGHGSVATPGTPAGLALASERHGRLPWRDLLAPAIAIAREGFPMGAASTYYLEYVHEDLFGWHAPSHAAIHDDAGELLPTGARVHVAALAESLEQLAEEGVAALYAGDLGARIVDDVLAHDGILTREDLRRYEAVVREPVTVDVAGWHVATNPPPAIGGVTLGAMLTLLAGEVGADWGPADVERVVRVQEAVLGWRVEHLDVADDRGAAGRELLALARADGFRAALQSPSTVHISATDGDGQACAITASAGYGSGVMPPGTGLWLNNCLGEQELNRRGLHAWEPGDRLPSNMAPTVARADDGASLAIGSPGADRITTAILQTLLRFTAGASLVDAIAAPRVHVRHGPDGRVLRVGHEEDLPMPPLDLPTGSYHRHAMFFGGVTATLRRADGSLTAAADPRRGGGTEVSP
ncbi:MAG: gamma-glutamyltransferase [Actinobacteria bacterium]|nr:gamma-glutamyltransferase [Actinomycetota bacterium]